LYEQSDVYLFSFLTDQDMVQMEASVVAGFGGSQTSVSCSGVQRIVLTLDKGCQIPLLCGNKIPEDRK
jgi:hypothetical protein